MEASKACLIEELDGLGVRVRQVRHVHVVAHARAVGRGVVRAEHAQHRETPHCHLVGERRQNLLIQIINKLEQIRRNSK